MGGRLKFEEMISGRFADALGTLYLGYATLWFFEQHQHVEGLDKVFKLSMEQLLLENQKALVEISTNFPIPGLGTVMQLYSFPIGLSPYNGPSDKLRQEVHKVLDWMFYLNFLGTFYYFFDDV